MSTPRYRADWLDIVTRAKAAQGRWVTGINAAPIRVLETANRRASNRWLNDPDGRLYALAGERATLEDGTVICDIYVRWEWFNPEQAPKINVTNEEFRTIRVSRNLKERATAESRRTGATMTSFVIQVLEKYVRHGTRLKPPLPAHEQYRATVPEDLWTKALFRAEKDGMPLTEVVRYELNKLLP